MSVLLDIDPLSGAASMMDYDTVTKDLIVTRKQNVDALLDANVASYNDSGQAWRGADNDFWHVATVPMDTLYGWLQEFNAGKPIEDCLHSPFFPNDEWERFMYGRLNMSEYRKLRTAPVTI